MIISIIGPTGVGKTKLSVELAKRLNGIIINCDAMQVYKYLDIGTAKIKESEKEGVPHYLFDFVEPTENYTVFDYQQDARRLIEENKDKTIIFVGGTGLYLKAALYDYQFQELNDTNYDKYSNEELYELVCQINKETDIHINNRKRMIAYLKRGGITPKSKELYKSLYIGLTTERQNLYKIIDDRVLKMFENGLEEEVRKLYDKGVHSKALETAIGYKELYEYFSGTITKEEAIEKIQKNSRHYAKRQYTFFNHQLPVKWFNVNYNNFKETINEVYEYVENNKSTLSWSEPCLGDIK